MKTHDDYYLITLCWISSVVLLHGDLLEADDGVAKSDGGDVWFDQPH